MSSYPVALKDPLGGPVRCVAMSVSVYSLWPLGCMWHKI